MSVCCRLTFLLFLVCWSWSVAMELSADSIDYFQDGQVIHATNHVVITLNGVVVTTNEVTLDAKTKNILIPEAYDIFSRERSASGSDFCLDYGKGEGKSRDIRFSFDKYKIDGHEMSFDTEQVTLRNLSMTACKMPSPNYYIQASSLQIYHGLGFLYATNAVMMLYGVPVAYLPLYIYGNKQYSRFAQQVFIPDLGVNDKEGSYIIERVPYLINPQNTGVIHVSTYSIRGPRIGVEHTVRMGDSSLNLFGYSIKDDVEYVAELIVPLRSTDKKDTSDALEKALSQFQFLQERGLTIGGKFSKNQYLNYHYVNFQPEVYMFGDYEHVGWIDTIRFFMSKAQIMEDKNINQSKVSTTFDFSKTLAIDANNSMHVSTIFSGDYYDVLNRQQWYSSAGFSTENPWFRYSLDYIHYHSFVGNSPFAFDAFQIDSQNKIIFSLDYYGKWLRWNVLFRYGVQNQQFYDRNYSVILPIGCLGLVLTWKDVQREISWHVSLD